MFLKGGTLTFGFGFDFGDDYMERLKLLVAVLGVLNKGKLH